MREILRTICSMDLENTYGHHRSTKVNGEIQKCMERDYVGGLMDVVIRDGTIRARNRDMDNSIGLMVGALKGAGEMDNGHLE